MPPALFVYTILLSVTAVFGQTSLSPTPNPQAADSVLSQADAAFRGSVTVTDIQLQGTVTSYAGSTKRSGSVTLLADNQGHSKTTYAFGNESEDEYASGYGEAPDCEWKGSDSVKHPAAVHNCWIPGNWFLPALSYAAAFTGKELEYSHLELDNRPPGPVIIGASAEANKKRPIHLRLRRIQSSASPAMRQQIQKLSAIDLFLDATTMLPQSLRFNVHPDNDMRANLQVEIKPSDYRDENGVKVPFHIQRYINGSLAYDIVISSATINTGSAIQK